jgi:uncharacterized cupin superfamily protein
MDGRPREAGQLDLAVGGDQAIFVTGTSEWERHSAGDEIVTVVDGETTCRPAQ